ncbi:MAG: threonine synthase [Nitrososphaerales archaeon]
MGKISHLECRECHRHYPAEKIYFCPECFGPLDVKYRYDGVGWSKDIFQHKPRNLWRYLDLLPIENVSNIVNIEAGYTPLIKAKNLGREIGLKNLYIKNDTVNPTFSFKDRPAGVGVSKALELGLKSVGCASTGNLAAATAAYAAKAGLRCYIFVPIGVEPEKIAHALTYSPTVIEVNGSYDTANRIAAQAAEAYGIGVVNINLRTYYVEGSKTLAFEVAEQLGWQTPDHIVAPVGSGAMLHAVSKGFKELEQIGLIHSSRVKFTAAQGRGCAPVVEAFRKASNVIEPVEHPNTIAKSLAIGEPGDGIYVLRKLRESGGYAEDVSDIEIVEGIKMLAKTEGIFSEPAGGVVIGALKRLVEESKIESDETVVCLITGSGLKATEALVHYLPQPLTVEPELENVAQIIAR